MPSILRDNQQLRPHFSLYELTVTTNADLQEQNRTLDDDQMGKLNVLAQFAEGLRHLCGDVPLRVHSGYRCAGVNGATLGASSTSQHPKCEALDFDVPGQTIEQTFQTLYQAAKDGKLCFGQLIIEEADRDYGVAKWVHCSVIGTLNPDHVGQVLRAAAGPDGKFAYTLIERLDFKI